MIRHVRRQPLPPPIPALPVAVIESALGASLMASIGAALLLQAGLLCTLAAAIAMSAIAV
jgi:hypothetical protein